jgi:hypothetical protein
LGGSFVIAVAHVHRLENIEIVLVDDVALGVARRELDVGDDRVVLIARVHLAGRNAGDELILPDDRERVAAERDAACTDVDPRNARLGHRGCGEDAGGRQQAGDAETKQCTTGRWRPACRRAACDVTHDSSLTTFCGRALAAVARTWR